MRVRSTSPIGTPDGQLQARVADEQVGVGAVDGGGSRRAEIFVDVRAVGHRHDDAVDVAVREHPAERGLCERRVARFVRAHVVQSRAHQRLHGLHADVLALGLLQHPWQVRLDRDHVHVLQELLVELRVLAEVVGNEDRVGEIVIERMVEALDQPARVTRHAGEADLALPLRVDDERLPLGVRQPRDVVHGVVQIDVDAVGL